MNLSHARVVLRPRRGSEIFDLALRWYAGPARLLFAKLALFTLCPSILGCAIARYVYAVDWLWIWLAVWGLATFHHGIFLVASSRLMFERDVTVGAVLRHFGRTLPRYVAAWLATRFFLALSASLVVTLPMVWVRVAFVHHAVLLEGLPTADALTRARRIAAGAPTEVMSVLVAGLAALAGAAYVGDALGGAALDFVLQIGRPFGKLTDGGSLSALLGFHLAVPYVASVGFLHYVDRRTRQDGWDIQLRLTALRTASEGAPTSDGGARQRA